MDITSRIDAVTQISKVRMEMGGIQPPPKSAKIELTSKCNLRCKFCAVRTRAPGQLAKDIDFYLFQKITEDLRLSGVEEIGLFYLGEPFTSTAILISAVEWCKETLEFPYIFLTSNAVDADQVVVDTIMDMGIDSIKWSVNSCDPRQFNAITGGSGKQFERAIKNIQNAWENRAAFGYKTMLSASSILYEGEQKNRMEIFLDREIKPYVDKHYWLPLYQMSMYKEKIKNDLGFEPTAGNMGRIDEETMTPNRPPLPCWSAFTEAHIRVDGGLSVCCFGADDKFDVGVLDGANFMKCWNSKKFQEIRNAQLMTMNMGNDALKGTMCEVCVAY